MLAFGGGNTMLPELQRQVVDLHHWMTAREFGALFALAQAAPGPNMMIVPLVGWQLAGPLGLLVASVANFGISSLLLGIVMHLWERFRDRPWRRIVQAGLVPITAGLVAASAVLIGQATTHEWVLLAIAAASAAVMTLTRLHPLAVLALGGLIGLTGFGLP
ncbi:chromate transporter [Bosea sp. PAMC 26642]|nr:chromate transporter [Bosea sp. PAMC 26642]